jgi:ElaB/YqjD/DUF883 family membrane-anchored ribosome-binding protein
MAEDSERVEGFPAPGESRVEQARAVVNEKIGAAKQKLGEVSHVAGQKLQEVTAQASEKTAVVREKAAESLRHGYDRVRKDFDDLNSDVNAYVKDNPGRSVLIAAGIGFVLGLLIRRRR